MGSHVHVIDGDSRRRAQISRELMGREFHAEIYENTDEFLKNLPEEGTVLLNEQPAANVLSNFFGSVRRSGHFYPVSVYSDDPTPERIVHAISQGAIDYLQWPFQPEKLNSSLQRLQTEGARRLRVERERSDALGRVGRLTVREKEVLVSLLHGNSNKEVAKELGISSRTVEIYRKNMMDKIGARSPSEAARIAIYADLWELQAA